MKYVNANEVLPKELISKSQDSIICPKQASEGLSLHKKIRQKRLER